MRLCGKVWMAALLLALPVAGWAANCTTQAELLPQDRAALAAAGERFSAALLQQDYSSLQAALLPAMSQDWEGIRGALEQGAALVKGGKVQLRAVYLLDASTQTATSDAQFFCSNVSGTLTVTISMRALPPGRYAVILADAAGAPLAGQLGFVLVWDASGSAPGWKLGGVSERQGAIAGHEGVWYWTHARELARENAPWSAWFCYEAARYLLLPVDFLSSPNLDKLGLEQSQLKGSPQDAFPYTLVDGARTWKVDAVRVDTTLHEADLSVTYESLGIADPAAARTEAMAVLSALLKSQPGIRENFHGLWAFASKDGKVTPVIELPMAQIP